MSSDVTFFFDPICPFTWRTSRWLRSMADKRGMTVEWRLLSLAILNEGREIPEQYRDGMARGWRAARLLTAADRQHGQEAMARLYTEIGTRVHGYVGPGSLDGHPTERRTLDTELLVEALAAADLPAELIASADDTALDDAIRESHAAGQARVGTESGSPIVAFGDGPGFFGPVVVPVPDGESAEKLFDAVRLLSAVPEFSEIKRSRNSF
jgi:2-hydroxychromene-2-carboxylate isomerase